VDVGVRTRGDRDLEGLRPQIRRLSEECLNGLQTLWRDIVEGTADGVTTAPARRDP
jgi:hypothetical protein